MKLKIRLIWRKAMTDFNGVVAEYVYKQRDDEDKQQIDSVIEKAKRKLPEFRGMRFGNHYIGGAK